MPSTRLRERVRSISPTVGVVLMVLLVILLVAVLTYTVTGFAETTREESKVHAVGDYEFDVVEASGDTLRIEPRSVSLRGADLVVRVNGHRVHTWDGEDTVEMTCLYPGDHLRIVSEKGDSTSIVDEHRMIRSLKCDRIRPLPEKFEYAYVDYEGTSEKVRVQPDFTFGVEIDPDGPGSDGGPSAVFKEDIGTIPVTNEWHYIRRYDRGIEGFDPPVWVVVMTDNVHWKNGGGSNGLNWTDDPAGEPGIDSYEIDGGSVRVTASGSEPTNDIYFVFKPGCDESEIKIVNISAGYHNRIYVEGDVAIEDTYDYSVYNSSRTAPPVTLDAPGVNCPGS